MQVQIDPKSLPARGNDGAQRVAVAGIAPTFTTGVRGFAPAATPTDVAALIAQSYGRKITLRRVSVSGVASAAATVDVLLQRSPNGGAGTQVSLSAVTAKADSRDYLPTGLAYYYTANRTSNGDGVSSTRPLVAVGRMTFATATTAGVPCVWEFGGRGAKPPAINDLVEWIVVNLAGQAMPSGAALSIDFEWVEEATPRVVFAGDSTTSNASTLFADLGRSGLLTGAAIIDNMGSNGFRLTDFINNTNGVTYPLSAVSPRAAGVLVLCYGINDVRAGACTQDQLISMIDAVIYATLNGTVNGASYTSPLGARTTFTWGATLSANPDCQIILWGPNGFTTDDVGAAGYVTATGAFSGMSVAQAAQAGSDILYNGYEAFRGDGRVYSVLQKQDQFGRTCLPSTAAPLMLDQLHLGPRGQTLEGRTLKPVLAGAIAKVASLNY